MNFVVIYPGRFHPFHRGHKASYDYLVKKYGDNVYIATSNTQAPLTSPFSFNDKQKMITKLGVPSGRVIRVTNPYQANEITKSIADPENTVLIFAVSEKDMMPVSSENPKGPRFKFSTKKDGTPTYIQPLPDNAKKFKPMTQHAYVEVTPTVNFQVRGRDANSASEIRKEYVKANDADRDQIIADLYGEPFPEIRDIFDNKLSQTEEIRNIVKEARNTNPQRALKLLETIQKLERKIQKQEYQQLDEILPAIGAAVGRALVGAEAGAITRGIAGLAGHEIGSEIEDRLDLEEDPDYIDEKWSQKYKRSIDCSNPRGFSQRAHCAGRKK